MVGYDRSEGLELSEWVNSAVAERKGCWASHFAMPTNRKINVMILLNELIQYLMGFFHVEALLFLCEGSISIYEQSSILARPRGP